MASVEELTQRLRAFADERDWGQFHTPKNLVMAAAGEMGELVAEFQWLTPEQSADVLGVDLVQAALDKLEHSAQRYPVESSRGSAAKAPHDQPPTP